MQKIIVTSEAQFLELALSVLIDGADVSVDQIEFKGWPREGANKRGNSSRLTQSFHFFSLSRSFLP